MYVDLELWIIRLVLSVTASSIFVVAEIFGNNLYFFNHPRFGFIFCSLIDFACSASPKIITLCSRLAATVANAVPNEPPPNTAMFKMVFSSIFGKSFNFGTSSSFCSCTFNSKSINLFLNNSFSFLNYHFPPLTHPTTMRALARGE